MQTTTHNVGELFYYETDMTANSTSRQALPLSTGLRTQEVGLPLEYYARHGLRILVRYGMHELIRFDDQFARRPTAVNSMA